MKLNYVAGLGFLLLPFSALSSNLGTYGDVWGIAETDFLTVVQQKLGDYIKENGEEKLQEEMKARVQEHAMRPAPVEGVHRGKETHVKLFDPAFEVTRDLADQNGTVFTRKGQRISPFDVIPVFNETLYFIDGDDKEQLAWMQQQKPQTPIHKVILINGNIKDTADVLHSRIYFDQGGTLIQKFGIRQVPAIVDQAPGEQLLRITEVGLKG